MTAMFTTVPGAICKDCGCPINCEITGYLTDDDLKSNFKYPLFASSFSAIAKTQLFMSRVFLLRHSLSTSTKRDI